LANDRYRLGTVQAAEQLLTDLYVDLRRRLRAWAEITHQTAQARMGYVGQHLVSAVTGYPGGKSGARGHDLILPDGKFSEIKTCSRVDQLGKCGACGAAVLTLEEECAACGSPEVVRKDDSKWLIGIRNDDELRRLLDPMLYYLVLFDFEDFTTAETVRASIYTIDPRAPGFALCMIDYYYNVRAKSTSKAPHNLWPFRLKFDLMRPLLIYRSLVRTDDTIETVLFPGRDALQPHVVAPLPEYSRTTSFTRDAAARVARKLGLDGSEGKKRLLERLQEEVLRRELPNDELADLMATELYRELIEPHLRVLPPELARWVRL
jgi:hypothetical protein